MNEFDKLRELFLKIETTDCTTKPMPLSRAISKAIRLIVTQTKKGNKIFLIGNGGSAAIASHISTDFLKNAKIPAMAFNDSSLLTCISNDFGYEYVFQKPIELLSQKGDILFSISSSGKSKNILNAAREAKKKDLYLITLSGFSRENPLKKLGEINFYVPSNSYGDVEIVHLAICHCIVDNLAEIRSRPLEQ